MSKVTIQWLPDKRFLSLLKVNTSKGIIHLGVSDKELTQYRNRGLERLLEECEDKAIYLV